MILGVNEVFISADNTTPTKRNVLKIIASVYDPIGFLSPITIQLKLLFQEICVSEVQWDNVLPDELVQKWQCIMKYLRIYADQRVNRRYFIDNVSDPIERM